MKVAPFRLALRVEGDWWVAYLAKSDSMVDAIELGRILKGIVKDEDNKRVFKTLMTKVIQDAVKYTLGVTPEMVEQPAPEHERSK